VATLQWEFEELRRKAAAAIAEFSMLDDVQRLGVAVSGGADSLALLEVLADLQLGVQLVPVFVHQYPAQDPARLQELVTSRYALPLEVVHRDTQAAASRAIRLGKAPCRACAPQRAKALGKAAESLGLDSLATGHHLDDVAATLLMNLLHGSCVDTMRPTTRRFGIPVPIVRPLYFSREALVKAASPVQASGVFDCGMCSAHAVERSRVQHFISETFAAHGTAAEESVVAVIRGAIGA
jgi:tRNA 2-thiocytidine biosynthesis protein TtcA